MRYFHESHCRLNFHVVNRCYFSDVLQHSNAKTWLDSWSWKQHVAIFGWRIGASSQEKKKWSWRKTNKIWKGGTAACLPTFVAEKQALAEICACIAISVCHIANCFGWRQYVLRNLPVGFPVRPIIGPEKCFCRCRLHITSPGVHQDPRNVFKPFKGYNDRGRQVRAGEDSRL